MISCPIKFLLCASFGFSLFAAGAQQRRPAAIGNAILGKQRSTAFLAERGVPASSSTSPAQMLADARAHYRGQQQAAASSITQIPAWLPVGPAQVTTAQYDAIAGHVTSIAADPSDPTGNTVYIGTANGGVWKSTNAAGNAASATLVPLTDNFFSTLSSGVTASLSIGALSIQPVAPGTTPVLLAGTGNPNDTTASYFGNGILRSTDGGLQWSLITGSADHGTNSNINFSFAGNGFAGFAWGTIAGTPVVVAAVSQVEQGVEVNAGYSSQSILGIYYSVDQGQTWSMATINDPGGQVQSAQSIFSACSVNGSRLPCGNAATSVVWNPVRKQFYAAVRFHGYYQSSDGQTWTRVSIQPGANLTASMCPYNTGYSGSQACPIYNGVLAVQPVTGDTFALTTDINNLDQGLWQDSCLLASGSCASSELAFTQIPDSALDCGTSNAPDCAAGNAQPLLVPEADYNLYLAAVPWQQGSTSHTLLFVGSGDIYRCDLGQGCAWRNTTHAQSFDCNSAHVAPAQHAIDATFGATGLIYFGNDGGLWRSTDAVDQQQQQCSADDATHFQNLNLAFSGSIAEVEDLAPDASNPQNMMASLGPLGTAAPLNGAPTWQQVLNGEGDYAAIDSSNPQNWYATSEFGIGINLCTSGSSCGIATFGSPVINSTDVGDDGFGQIIPAPWILDPQNSSNMIIGTCRVWRGSSSGGIENQLSTMLDGNNGSYCDGNAEIRTLAASGQTSDASGTAERIYAGMAGLYDGGSTVAGHIFAQSVVSGAGPSSWIDLSHNLNNFNPNGYDISSIYVDPHSAGGQTVYATVQGFGAVQIYRSADGGSTWQNISNNLANVPANSVIVDPNNANTVYLATDVGVYYTQNVTSCGQPQSSCWSPLGTSLPNVPVTQLRAVNSSTGPVLLAATYGRGVWQLNLPDASATTATIAPTALTFASEQIGTDSAPQQLLVANTGSVSLLTTSIAIAGNYTESDTCTNQSIAPGNACIIEVRFAPSQVGADNGTLTLYANVSGGGQLTVQLTGIGTPNAAITLTPNTVCFAPTLIGESTSAPCQFGSAPQQVQSIVIANTGAAVATLTSVSISGDFALTANTCGSSLAPANSANDSCTVNVVFTPTASGNRIGMLTVVDSAGTQTAQLLGTGQLAATDLLTPSTLAFATQAIGSSSSAQQVTLTNNGDQALQNIAVQSSSAVFTAANNCGTSLAGHSSCAILVSFFPSIIGSQSGTLTVSDTITQGSGSISRSQQVSLTGTGLAPAGIVSAAPNLLDFGYYAVGQTSPVQSVAFTNNGSTAITSIQFAVTGDFSLEAAAQNPCEGALDIGESCNIGVVFSPAQVNRRTGSLTITGANLPSALVIALSGNGAAFTMKVTGSSSQIVTGNQVAQPFQVEIDSVNGSTGPVSLTCSVVPANASCTAEPGSITLTGGSSQSASVSFTSGQQARASGSGWTQTTLAIAMLLPIGFLGFARRRRRVLALCTILVLFFPAGCGVNSSSGSASSGGTQTSQYTLTVTGSMPGLEQTVTMQVNVQ
ncbi:MAG TPA: choice-of-anchor D domain-containing protein [Silvibacterium sp.]|nr:choice-of-anchor D domain-containing protein [Silvibacterium sp.]